MSGAPIEMHSLGGGYPPPPRREAPGSLGRGYREAEDRAKAQASPSEGAMDNTSYYGMAAASWYALLALPLLLLPRLVLFFASDDGPRATRLSQSSMGMTVPGVDRGSISRFERPSRLTSLEELTLRSLGLGLLALASITVFVVVPAYKPHAPGRKAVTTVLAILGCVTAVVSWNSPLGAMAVITGVGNGVVGAWGWYAIMFGEDDYKFGKYLKNDSRLKRL
ncbi:hypothetical protein CcaverHIS002_0306920 [Cutaneotrichosporon cavernicola]|uniref:Uncharacterized protein n=1 Tax=Cutaneotrichosporon cavernicola TaxID=279322 RepID=A0AA48I6I7_9TREE|nr:uncharacterized protein CcaverHIS019_0306840 [Cutaneotrichosporon cavernicola]BEI82824.1 hypothetical protein CcaverHIS002_0306920 [Cutaneotrichosporon cavernicola]BEI90614.1 hypothetical protein CcaverHIS019_0306840 [Cutaneotrichosporon cavernicola]BEI98392.1 hypothetical protein CcaverHIS631_0306910 [Cutaneotrichosporon cavernicola]BEJ06165.1 hypothetical protein CcaverHIS641_0306870 [Cutaneotrichosporon cavernicola]